MFDEHIDVTSIRPYSGVRLMGQHLDKNANRLATYAFRVGISHAAGNIDDQAYIRDPRSTPTVDTEGKEHSDNWHTKTTHGKFFIYDKYLVIVDVSVQRAADYPG